MEKYINYIESANRIKIHLKQEWEDLEVRLDYLKGEIQTYDSNARISKQNFNAVTKNVLKIVNQQMIEDVESIYVDNYFADLFENYFTILSKLKEIKYINTLDYNYVFDLSYTTIANIRNLIKKLDEFTNILFNPITCPNKIQIKDDRIEITLTSIKNLYGEVTPISNKSYKNLLWLRVFGYPMFATTIISLIAIITAVIVIFAKFYAESRQIVYLQQESMEAYNVALKQLTTNFITTVTTNFVVVIASKLVAICPFLALIYFIVGKTLFKKLIQKDDITIEEKYILAFMHVDKGINLFKHSIENHKILIIECAEAGNVDANIRLGELYEKGLFEDKKVKKPSKQSLEEALRCYKRAFPNKIAVAKYNKLENKLTVN